jgi:hypothetical protein
MSKLSAKYIDDIFVEDSAIGDGSTTSYELSEKPVFEDLTKVYLNGIKRAITTDYTLNISTSSSATEFNGGGTGVARSFVSSSASFDINTDFSFALWIKPSLTGSGALDYILGKGEFNAATTQFHFSYNQGTGNFRFSFSDGTNERAISVGGGVAGEWHFIVCRYDSTTRKGQISLNNSSYSIAGTALGSALNTGTGKDFYIGARAANDGNGFDGIVDQVYFFNERISDGLKTKLYNFGQGIEYSKLSASDKTNLVSSYSMNQGDTTQIDQHGSNNLSARGTGSVQLVTGTVVDTTKDITFLTAPAIGQEIDIKYIKE